MYMIKGIHKFAELDNWEHGCDGKGYDDYIDYTLQSETIGGILQELVDFCDSNDWELDAWEEIGRVDVQVYEDNGGCKASERELEEWKQGKIDLWLCTYTAYIVKCEPVNLLEELK